MISAGSSTCRGDDEAGVDHLLADVIILRVIVDQGLGLDTSVRHHLHGVVGVLAVRSLSCASRPGTSKGHQRRRFERRFSTARDGWMDGWSGRFT